MLKRKSPDFVTATLSILRYYYARREEDTEDVRETMQSVRTLYGGNCGHVIMHLKRFSYFCHRLIRPLNRALRIPPYIGEAIVAITCKFSSSIRAPCAFGMKNLKKKTYDK